MNAEAIQDAELVRRFNGGDESAFAEIMSRHQSRIFAAAMSLLHNHADAEEITQDTFVRAHRGFTRFRGDSSVATWLHRIAVNLAPQPLLVLLPAPQARDPVARRLRRRRRRRAVLRPPLVRRSRSSQESARNEFVSAVEACMEQLEAGHRSILTMRTVLDQSYEAIAEKLGINVGTVKSRIARARERLRSRLAEQCPEFARDTDPADWFEPARGGGQVNAAC